MRLLVVDIEAWEKGDVVTIGFSKGDQAGEGQTVAALAVPGNPYCPVTVLRDWRQAAAGSRQPAMYGISPRRHYCTSWWSSTGLQFQTQLSETGRFLPRHARCEFASYVVDNVRCGKTARPGLCVGRPVTDVPTAESSHFKSSCCSIRLVFPARDNRCRQTNNRFCYRYTKRELTDG